MRRGFLFVLAVATLFCVVMAPGAHALLEREWGVKGGWVNAELAGDDVDQSSVSEKSGAAVGLFYRIHVVPFVRLQIEGMYVQKGAELVFVPDASFDLDYLEFPVLGIVSYPVLGVIKARALGGITLGFNTKAEVVTPDSTVSLKDDVKNTDWSGIFGLGLEAGLGRLQATGEVRWEWGLGSIDDTGGNADIKNKTFSVLVGLTIPFGP